MLNRKDDKVLGMQVRNLEKVDVECLKFIIMKIY
jgi:hypothetical protein